MFIRNTNMSSKKLNARLWTGAIDAIVIIFSHFLTSHLRHKADDTFPVILPPDVPIGLFRVNTARVLLRRNGWDGKGCFTAVWKQRDNMPLLGGVVTPDQYAPTNYVSMMVADVLMPNRHQDISSHHTDLIVIWVWPKTQRILSMANVPVVTP